MNGELVPLEVAIPAFAMPRDELINTMQNSLYPGAKKESVGLVISYCMAQRLDPLQKPVHIVPMWDKNLKAMRDTIMPGIGLYRVQAARTGQHAGTSEPQFGPMVAAKLGDVDIELPEWCKVTVLRQLSSGVMAEYAAVEYWMENYATASKDTKAPNAMWRKRPRGQIAKCAEAQALRKAFPELGSEPTAEEMEGKTVEHDEATAPPARAVNEFMPSPKVAAPASAPPAAAIEPPPANVDTTTGEYIPAPATGSSKPATEGMRKSAGNSMQRNGKTDVELFAAFGFVLADMPADKVNSVIVWARGA